MDLPRREPIDILRLSIISNILAFFSPNFIEWKRVIVSLNKDAKAFYEENSKALIGAHSLAEWTNHDVELIALYLKHLDKDLVISHDLEFELMCWSKSNVDFVKEAQNMTFSKLKSFKLQSSYALPDEVVPQMNTFIQYAFPRTIKEFDFGNISSNQIPVDNYLATFLAVCPRVTDKLHFNSLEYNSESFGKLLSACYNTKSVEFFNLEAFDIEPDFKLDNELPFKTKKLVFMEKKLIGGNDDSDSFSLGSISIMLNALAQQLPGYSDEANGDVEKPKKKPLLHNITFSLKNAEVTKTSVTLNNEEFRKKVNFISTSS